MILLLVLASVTAYSLLPDTDYFGGDLISIHNVNGTMKCLSICEKVTDCKLATWCRLDSTCYVKNNKTTPSYKEGCDTIDMYPAEAYRTVTTIPTTEATISIPTPTTSEPKSDAASKSISMAALVLSTYAAVQL